MRPSRCFPALLIFSAEDELAEVKTDIKKVVAKIEKERRSGNEVVLALPILFH